jgi:hypothetical protein
LPSTFHFCRIKGLSGIREFVDRRYCCDEERARLRGGRFGGREKAEAENHQGQEEAGRVGGVDVSGAGGRAGIDCEQAMGRLVQL